MHNPVWGRAAPRRAEEWREALQGAIGRLATAASIRRSSSTGSLASSVDYQEARSVGEDSAGGVAQAPAQQGMQGRGGGEGGKGAVEKRGGGGGGGEDGGAVRKGRSWASVLHINGVAGEEGGEAGGLEGGASF